MKSNKKTKKLGVEKFLPLDTIPSSPLRYCWALTKLTPWYASLAVLCVTIAKLLDISLAFILKQIVDVADQPGKAGEEIFIWVVLFPTTVFVMFMFWRLSGFLGMRWLTRVETNSFKTLFSYVSHHSHTYFINRFAGSINNKIGNASGGAFKLLDDILWGHYGAVLGIIASGVLIFMTSSIIGWIYVGIISFLLPLNVYLSKFRRPNVVAYAQKKTAFKGMLVDIFTNVGAMRQYARRDQEEKLIHTKAHDLREADIKQWQQSEWILVANNVIIVLAIGVIMIVMYHLWQQDLVTTGDFVLIAALMINLQDMLTFIGNSISQFVRVYGDVEEGLDEILHPHEIPDAPNAQKLKPENGQLIWSEVDFGFGKNQVFKKFNLTITPGQRVGLVGSSGAGKTTFVSLLLRQHELSGGAILIDGQNIAEVTQDSLRQNIAVVPQEPMLFHRTIKENIAYGKPNATVKEIEQAAKQAQAHKFITDLPEGYDTMVGERGVKLSGGQKQRVAIARAMLKDAPILVLDEATSALDSESEVEIQKALHRLMRGKTVIAIAHRLSTLREMDRIIVLDKGKIVEDGSHDALVQYGGVYAGLWEHQAGGFLQD